MDAKEMASKLDGSEYPLRLADIFTSEIEQAGLVVVYGASDDLMEFRGSIRDEIGVYDGGYAYLDGDGMLKNICESDECPHFQTRQKLAKKIEAIWCGEEGFSWAYKTEIPHETFDIMEDGEIYCRGIVFSLSDV